MNMITASEVFSLINSNNSGDYLFGVDFELHKGFFIKNPLQQSEVMWRVGDYSNFVPNSQPQGGSHFVAHPMGFGEFEKKFNQVHVALQKGDSFLTNLTIRTELESDYSLREIAMRCNSPYLLMLSERFVCFSPETFVRVDEQGQISSNPMKGTISANESKALQVLLDDPKESAEHNTIVDLIRNDLSIVAHGVSVARFRYADLLRTSTGDIIQTSSRITGQLLPQYRESLGDAISHLLPAGSISGAPKRSTLNIIAQAEQLSRGFYCGVFGYHNGRSLDTAVMIRFIEQDESGKRYFRSGSGITAQSSAQSEYDEMIKKIYLPFENI